MRWVGRLTEDEGLAEAVATKRLDHASVSDRERALLRYAERLALRPGTVEREDVQALRDAGYGDEAIVDAALTVALFSFMNRIVDGLGGLLEGEMLAKARRLGLPLHAGTYEHLEGRGSG